MTLSLLSIFFLLNIGLSQNILLLTPDNVIFPQNDIHFKDNNSYSQNFIINNKLCCTPPKLFILSDTKYVILDVQDEQIMGYQANFDGSGATLNYSYSGNHVNTTFECEDGAYGSGLIKNKLKLANGEKYSFYYWYTCGDSQNAQYNFDWSTIILILISCTIIFMVSHLGRIQSFDIQVQRNLKWIAGCDQVQLLFINEQVPDQIIQFQGFKVTAWFFLLYLVAIALFYFIIYFVGVQKSYQLDLIFFSIFFIGSGTLCIDELLCLFSADCKLQTKVYKLIRICDIQSLILSSALLTGYLLGGQIWLLNDILAILITFIVLKLFKITSFKDATYILTLCTIYDIIQSVLLNQVLRINDQQYVLQYANLPLLIQLPAFDYTLNSVCSWLSIKEIIIPGLVISYLYRYDLNRESRVYTVIGLFGLALGTGLWIVCQTFASRQQVSLSQGILVFPFIIVGVLVWSFKEGDLRQIWDGHFYDSQILVASIPRNDTRQSLLNVIQETELDPSLFKGMEKSSIS